MTDLSFLMLLFSILLVFISSTHSADSQAPATATIRPETRIINGQSTYPNEFPHQILMTYIYPNRSAQSCGGNIISNSYVLTAAHCVYCAKPHQIEVTPGVHYASERGRNAIKASELFVHPCYNQDELLKENDLAIIKLSKDLSFNTKVNSIQFDTQDLAKPGIVGKIIGWGQTNAADDSSAASSLNKAELEVSSDACRMRLEEYVQQLEPGSNESVDINHVAQICTTNSASFVCSGDSGGPFLCQDNAGKNILCGVASMAMKESLHGLKCLGPSIYTRVYHYRHWIEDIMRGDKKSEQGCIGQRFTPKCPKNVNGSNNSVALEAAIILIFVSLGVILTV